MAASKCLYRMPIMNRYNSYNKGLKPRSKMTIESPPGKEVLDQLERIYGEKNDGIFFPENHAGKPVRVAYQGVRGSYCHEAAIRAFERCDAVPYCSGMDSAFAALESAAADVAIIPVENSLDGVIDRNYDLILRHPNVHVIGELLLPINHCLLGVHVGCSSVRRVVSHPQALAHCERRLAELAVEAEAVENAAVVARHVAENGAGDLAVIGSSIAAREFGLRVIEQNMQDDSSNTTRFLVLGTEGGDSICGGEYSKSTVAFSLREGTAGLFKALAIFSKMKITNFQSRPSRENPIRVVEKEEGVSLNYFEYIFFVDVEIPAMDSAMEKALNELKEISSFVRVVGSYSMTS